MWCSNDQKGWVEEALQAEFKDYRVEPNYWFKASSVKNSKAARAVPTKTKPISWQTPSDVAIAFVAFRGDLRTSCYRANHWQQRTRMCIADPADNSTGLGQGMRMPYWVPRDFLLQYTFPGEYVLDVFCSGGWTARAAMELGRNSVSLDSDQEMVLSFPYCFLLLFALPL